MKKETLLTIAVIALLLLNFGTLGFLLFRGPAHGPGDGPQLDHQIVETLHLDATQDKQFRELKSTHREQMQGYNRAYRSTMENYFALLDQETVAPSLQDSLLTVLSQIQKDRATVTYAHFAALKALCTPEQKKDFESLLPDLLQVILPPNPGNRPGR